MKLILMFLYSKEFIEKILQTWIDSNFKLFDYQILDDQIDVEFIHSFSLQLMDEVFRTK